MTRSKGCKNDEVSAWSVWSMSSCTVRVSMSAVKVVSVSKGGGTLRNKKINI